MSWIFWVNFIPACLQRMDPLRLRSPDFHRSRHIVSGRDRIYRAPIHPIFNTLALETSSPKLRLTYARLRRASCIRTAERGTRRDMSVTVSANFHMPRA